MLVTDVGGRLQMYADNKFGTLVTHFLPTLIYAILTVYLNNHQHNVVNIINVA